VPDQLEEFDRTLAVIESFLMRRLITGGTTKNYNRIFIDLIRNVEMAGTLSAQTVSASLQSGDGTSTSFPTDSDLYSALTKQPLYGRIAAYKVRAVLEALDAAACTTKSEALTISETLTIEHVMPQEWGDHWPLPAEALSSPDRQRDAAEERNILLHTLGNLTLITGSLNPSMSNSAWSVKRPELLKYSKLNLTQYFHDPGTAIIWDEAAIRQRTDYLYKQVIQIWPRNFSI
jgi:hypothetical protein